MEGSKKECHCTHTSCEGSERKRGVDILKVPLSGLIPVCVRVFNMSEDVLQEGGSPLRATRQTDRLNTTVPQLT